MMTVEGFVANRLAAAPGEWKRLVGGKFRRWIFYRLRSILRKFLAGGKTRLVIVPGLRGVGKSTVLWQIYGALLEEGMDPSRVLHLPVDQMLAYTGSDSVLEAYEAFSLHSRGRRVMLIDEITYSGRWPLELKVLHDRDPDIAFVVAGSSSLHLRVAESADLARRAVVEPLFPMSFGEYLGMRGALGPVKVARDLEEAIYSLPPGEALERLRRVEEDVISASRGFEPDRDLREFLEVGGLPFSALADDRLVAWRQVVDTVLRAVDVDLRGVSSFDQETVIKARRLVYSLALSQGAAVNLARLAGEIGMDKKTLLRVVDALERCELIFRVRPAGERAARVRVHKAYFATPTLRVAIRREAGFQTDSLGLLAEEAVAASLRKAAFLGRGGFGGVGYLPTDGEVDFILEGPAGRRMLVEVGVGRKERGAVSRVGGRRIVVHGRGLKLEGDILFIPLWLFLLI